MELIAISVSIIALFFSYISFLRTRPSISVFWQNPLSNTENNSFLLPFAANKLLFDSQPIEHNHPIYFRTSCYITNLGLYPIDGFNFSAYDKENNIKFIVFTLQNIRSTKRPAEVSILTEAGSERKLFLPSGATQTFPARSTIFLDIVLIPNERLPNVNKSLYINVGFYLSSHKNIYSEVFCKDRELRRIEKTFTTVIPFLNPTKGDTYSENNAKNTKQ